MHGRTPLLALVIAAAAALPAPAAAAPIPAGTYDVQLSGGSLDIGSLPSIPVDTPASFTIDIGTEPVTTAAGVMVPDSVISSSGGLTSLTGTVHVTVVDASVTLDPIAVSATLDVSFYVVVNVNVTVLGIPSSGTCTIGSAMAPIALHLTTAEGSPWDATTGAFALADRSFAVPSPSCPTPEMGAVFTTVTGATGAGNNSATADGQATRQPDPEPGTTPAPGTGTGTPTGTGALPGTGTETGSGTGTGGDSGSPPPAGPLCIVPRVVGKRLRAARRALRAAGCRARVAKKRKRWKRKRGTVVAQSRRRGARLPAGTRVKLTVSRGRVKARRPRSR